jgi:hypothetical protein
MDSGTASVPESWIGVALRLALISLSQNGLRYGKHTGVLDRGSVEIGAVITIAGWTPVRRAYRSPRFAVALRLALLSLSQDGLRYGGRTGVLGPGNVEIGAAITIAEWTPVRRAYRSPGFEVALRLVLLSLSQNGLRYGERTGVLGLR